MRISLYDRLSGRFADGRRIEQVSREEQLLQSIISNLTRLFNTRRGSILHLPEYGLPDITDVYRDVPDSIVELQGIIKEVVEKYEPRLRRVRVEHEKTDPFAMRLEFLLSGEMVDGARVGFQTTFSSSESARVYTAR
jgi:type VI secretion system protein